MSRQIQIRRGTAAEHDGFTGAIGEVTMDTTNNTLRVHDGATAGGHEVLKKSDYYSYTSNCITEIPQNIKLELNNGEITLKAGSIITYPNGTQVQTAADKSRTSFAGSYTGILFATQGSGTLTNVYKFSNINSGTAAQKPEWSSFYTGKVYFETDTKKMFLGGTTGWTEWAVALPIAVCTVTNSIITSVDYIFNGFGYVGSTIFALPGVKFLGSDGRNTNGSAKYTKTTVTNVAMETVNTSGLVKMFFSNEQMQQTANYKEVEKLPATPSINDIVYHKSDNILYLYNGVSWAKQTGWCPGPSATVKYSDGTYNIADFTMPETFQVMDYNNTEYISRQSMPSNRYIDLTLGTSGTTYAAPADGYYYLTKAAVNVGEQISFIISESGLTTYSYAGSGSEDLGIFIPVSKGNVVSVYYTATGNTDKFRFVYTNGSK